MIKLETILLGLILLIFLTTRLYQIGNYPTSVYWDEASIGYNAYSILSTTQDEWGKKFPIHFRAFGEFKLPVFIYTVTVSEWIFGLNPLALRIPAVIFSLGTLIVFYLLTLKITQKSFIALFATIFLSFSPWFFILSRVGYEATAGLFFFILGIYLFLIGKNYVILVSIISFILSMYSYNSFRVITPITLLILSGLNYRNLFTKKTLIVAFLSGFIFLISLIPIFKLYFLDAGNARFQAVSISAPNKILESAIFLKNYLSHFSPQFLFELGDNQPRFSVPNFGELFIVELPFLILGFICSLKRRYWISILMVLIGPIPAALTKESPHAMRSLVMLPFLSFISAVGVDVVWQLKKVLLKYLVYILILILSINFIFYFKYFILNYQVETSKDWQYAYKQIYTNYSSWFDRYDQIWISDEYAQPYIFTLYYLRYSPVDFRSTVSYNDVSDWGFSTVKSFGKFHFFKASSTPQIPKKSLVFILNKYGNSFRYLGTIYLMNNQKGFEVYETK